MPAKCWRARAGRTQWCTHIGRRIAVQSACALCGPIKSRSIDRLQRSPPLARSLPVYLSHKHQVEINSRTIRAPTKQYGDAHCCFDWRARIEGQSSTIGMFGISLSLSLLPPNAAPELVSLANATLKNNFLSFNTLQAAI